MRKEFILRSELLSKAFHITTMGCQMNEYNSDQLAQSLICSGFSPVSDPNIADIILINTCTVREKPEQKAFSQIGRMAVFKRKKPGLILGVVGCMAQDQGNDIIRRFPYVDLVMGPRELGGICGFLKKIDRDRKKIVATNLDLLPSRQEHSPGYFTGKVKAHISIMEGCNNFCSYCIVPFVRGREISRANDEIISEARHLITEGVKDITLLGQNVNSYMWKKENYGFTQLLHDLSALKGLVRLRFTTSHPKDLSPDLVQCFGGDLPNLCPHIHLPFQAGSNSVLKRMKRGYTRESYIRLIENIRNTRPDIAVTSDVMVGFPGESVKDFDMTLDLINKIQFDSLYSFKYSDRRGTLACKMDHKVDEDEKTLRLKALQDLQKQISLKRNKDLEGREFEILVEGQSRKRGQLTGRTTSNKVVNFEGVNGQIGTLVKVKVNVSYLNSLYAELL